MRLFTLGVDAQGRSCVVEEREVTTATAIPGVAVASLFKTEECPPVAPPPGAGVFDDMQMAPGTVSWMVVDLEPYSEEGTPSPAAEMHYNNTLELFCVLEGKVQTTLGAGALDLGVGDCVAMPGVDHRPGLDPRARACCRSASAWHPRARRSAMPAVQGRDPGHQRKDRGARS